MIHLSLFNLFMRFIELLKYRKFNNSRANPFIKKIINVTYYFFKKEIFICQHKIKN